MYTTHSAHPSAFIRALLISAVVIIAILLLAEFDLFRSLSSSAVNASNEMRPMTSSISTYGWNLSDAELPLLNLPDHLNGSLDLSLTYSMDQFQFPLFQSLYYNSRADKYILMVMPKDGVRAEFIDLIPAGPRGWFETKGSSRLQLTDKGKSKWLTTSEGSVYTFAAFANGEFHCSQIKDRNGVTIDLKYGTDGSIALISDRSGRTIHFDYDADSVESITQVWGAGSSKKRTWALPTNPTIASAAVNFAPASASLVKHIPSNALHPSYTKTMALSDQVLARIFGGPDAVAAANGFEPVGLGSQYPLYRGDLIGDDAKLRRGHLSYAMHVYGNANGTGDTDLYVPAGFTSHSNTPTPTDAAVTFYYPRLGNLRDVTLAVFHIANFQLTQAGDRVRIGNIGGRGGSISCYKHSHIEFYRGDTGLPSKAARERLRIDPVGVFSITPEVAARANSNLLGRSSY